MIEIKLTSSVGGNKEGWTLENEKFLGKYEVQCLCDACIHLATQMNEARLYEVMEGKAVTAVENVSEP